MGGTAYVGPTAMTHNNFHGNQPPQCCAATYRDTTHHQRTYHTRKGFLQYNPHPQKADVQGVNPRQIRTLCQPDGTLSHRQNNFKLQKVNEQSGDSGSVATAFGKDCDGMAQSNNKREQKGTNAMFFMKRDEVAHALAAGQFFTYANPVVDYQPQKEDPCHIRITAGGNLLKYEGNASVRMANLDKVKMHWNSVVSTKGKYMCPDI